MLCSNKKEKISKISFSWCSWWIARSRAWYKCAHILQTYSRWNIEFMKKLKNRKIHTDNRHCVGEWILQQIEDFPHGKSGKWKNCEKTSVIARDSIQIHSISSTSMALLLFSTATRTPKTTRSFLCSNSTRKWNIFLIYRIYRVRALTRRRWKVWNCNFLFSSLSHTRQLISIFYDSLFALHGDFSYFLSLSFAFFILLYSRIIWIVDE